MGGLGWSMLGLSPTVGSLYVVRCKCSARYMVDPLWKPVLCSVLHHFALDKQFVSFVVEADAVLNWEECNSRESKFDNFKEVSKNWFFLFNFDKVKHHFIILKTIWFKYDNDNMSFILFVLISTNCNDYAQLKETFSWTWFELEYESLRL